MNDFSKKLGYNITFSVDACNEAKELLRRDEYTMKIWNDNFSPAKAIGKCSYLLAMHDPESPEDFYEKYIKYADENHNLPIKERGLTVEEIISLAWEYKEKSERGRDMTERPLYVYVNDALCHIIVETFVGGSVERDLIRMIRESGITANLAGDEFDRDYGIDIVCEKDGKVFGVQVKPHTFLTSTRYEVGEDRLRLYEKRRLAKDREGLDTYYAVYVKDGMNVEWYRNANGGFSHAFGNLMTAEREKGTGKILVNALPHVIDGLKEMRRKMKENNNQKQV